MENDKIINKCTSCGVENFPTSFTPTCPEKKRMDAAGECFECAFWHIRAEEGQELVIDNYIYSVGLEPKEGDNRRQLLLGMAGRRFDIELFTGERFTTHNLWGGGLIPERYQERIPNTAKFLGAERAKAGDVTCWNPTPENLQKYPSYQQIKRNMKKA